MSNTHRAAIEKSVPPKLTLIAAGPHDFCVKALVAWINKRPLQQYERGLVLKIDGLVSGPNDKVNKPWVVGDSYVDRIIPSMKDV
jgi:hypothetical protein